MGYFQWKVLFFWDCGVYYFFMVKEIPLISVDFYRLVFFFGIVIFLSSHPPCHVFHTLQPIFTIEHERDKKKYSPMAQIMQDMLFGPVFIVIAIPNPPCMHGGGYT